MPPRGLKAALKKSAPAKLSGTGRFKGFVRLRQGKPEGKKLKGLTKRLASKLHSDGALPAIARRGEPRPGGHWKGKNGGRARGSRVDAQLTRLVNAGPAAMKNAQHVYNLTKMALAAFAEQNLEPVFAQRAVCSARVGTAADLIAYCPETNQIVVVELKCGHDHGRRAPAEKGGLPCKMKGPLKAALDTVLHRHLAQLTVTREMLIREAETMRRLGDLGVDSTVEGLLMYVTDSGVESFPLSEWWVRRGARILDAL